MDRSSVIGLAQQTMRNTRNGGFPAPCARPCFGRRALFGILTVSPSCLGRSDGGSGRIHAAWRANKHHVAFQELEGLALLSQPSAGASTSSANCCQRKDMGKSGRPQCPYELLPFTGWMSLCTSKRSGGSFIVCKRMAATLRNRWLPRVDQPGTCVLQSPCLVCTQGTPSASCRLPTSPGLFLTSHRRIYHKHICSWQETTFGT